MKKIVEEVKKTMGYHRRKADTEETKALIRDGRKKFVRYDEGAILYSIGINSFRKIASFSNEELHNALHSKNDEAKDIINDVNKWNAFRAKMSDFLKKAEKIPVLGGMLDDIQCMICVVDSYVKKEYKEIPVSSIISIVQTFLQRHISVQAVALFHLQISLPQRAVPVAELVSVFHSCSLKCHTFLTQKTNINIEKNGKNI